MSISPGFLGVEADGSGVAVGRGVAVGSGVAVGNGVGVGAGSAVAVGVGTRESAVAAAAARIASLVADVPGVSPPPLHANASSAIVGRATFRAVFSFLMGHLLRRDGMPFWLNKKVYQSRIRNRHSVHKM